jgi:hypothetical protein
MRAEGVGLMDPKQLLSQFDEYLASVGYAEFVELILCGGAVVAMRFDSSRVTQDVDTLTDLSLNLKSEAAAFTKTPAVRALELSESWLSEVGNCTGVDVSRPLKEGWEERAKTNPLLMGKILKVFSLCREDLILTKIIAFCSDEHYGAQRGGVDLEDLKLMEVRREEVVELVERLTLNLFDFELDLLKRRKKVEEFLISKVYSQLTH